MRSAGESDISPSRVAKPSQLCFPCTVVVAWSAMRCEVGARTVDLRWEIDHPEVSSDGGEGLDAAAEI